MLNIGFSELLLVVVAALLLIRPKDYPLVIKSLAKVYRQLRELIDGVKSQVDDVMKDSGIHEFRQQTRTIIDLDGKEQVAYDVNDILPKDKP